MDHPTASFNQCGSCICYCSDGGYSIFNCNPWRECYTEHAEQGEQVTHVQMLFSTSLVCLVHANTPQRLRLWNTSLGRNKIAAICDVSFDAPIKAIRMDRRRIVALLGSAIHIFDISNMKCLAVLDDFEDDAGLHLIAMSCKGDRSVLAIADASSEVVLYDALNLQVLKKIVAAKRSIAAIALSPCGSLLATASEHGTIIRVFDVITGALKSTLRRGRIPAHLHCLVFNSACTLLAAASSTQTVHVFDLEKGSLEECSDDHSVSSGSQASQPLGLLSRLPSLADVLPQAVMDVISDRSVACAHVGESHPVCSFMEGKSGEDLLLVALPVKAELQVLKVPKEGGCACELSSTHSLVPEPPLGPALGNRDKGAHLIMPELQPEPAAAVVESAAA
ncbi:unnamed protein product [Chrysoparadoxa australica]